MMAEEIDINSQCQYTLHPKRRKTIKLKLEYPPDARNIATNSGIHKPGKQGHAFDTKQCGLGINPRPGLRFEDFHDRADDMKHKDNTRLFERL